MPPVIENCKMISYSGYELKSQVNNPEAYRSNWDRLVKNTDNLIPLFEIALGEPFLVQDAYRRLGARAVMNAGLFNGELLVCLHGDRVVGLCFVHRIEPSQSAELEYWAAPAYRQSKYVWYFAKRTMAHIWKKHNLRKLKANVCSQNTAALKAIRRMGFFQVGMSPEDASFGGRYYDMVMLEAYNPEHFKPVVQVIADEFAQTTVVPTANDDAAAEPALPGNPAASRSTVHAPTGSNVGATTGTGATGRRKAPTGSASVSRKSTVRTKRSH
jgi:RimJ/RimL family protein N-acetyltransferase